MAGNLKTVLVAVDHTKEAECSLEYYLDHVHQHGYRIVLLQMEETLPYSDTGTKVDIEGSCVDMEENTYTAAKMMESRHAEKLRERQISWRMRTVSMEEAGDIIVEEARTENVVMVAIGTQGVVTMGNGFGPLPDYVIKHASCPVILLDSSSRDSTL